MVGKKRSPLAKGSRAVETREPKVIEKICVLFSFKHLVDMDDVGQSLTAWAGKDCKLLLGLLQKTAHISKQTILEAKQDSTLTVYGDFPGSGSTDFTCPTHLQHEKNWGVIRNIGGQKSRVAGFLKDNVFYAVFLDKDHKFWKSNKR